jgi:hypothetical protein
MKPLIHPSPVGWLGAGTTAAGAGAVYGRGCAAVSSLAKRDWSFAKAWLYDQLSSTDAK